MKLSGNELNRRIKHAVEAETPDVLPGVLLRLQEKEGQTNMDNTAIYPGVYNQPAAEAQEERKQKAVWYKWAAGIAAALVLAVIGTFAYTYYTPQSVISFDVNPSIMLEVNRSETVLSATALNADAQTILGDMDLKNANLDVAVNAIIGSMVKNGYISEAKNSILISVDSKNLQAGQQLQRRLTSEINALLGSYAVEGAVLAQTLTPNTSLKDLSEQYDISVGKAALVDMLVRQDPTLHFADLAPLSINDIYLLITSRQADLNGVNTTGQANSSAYIPESQAKDTALQHAGVAEAAILSYKVKLDYHAGRMCYEVEFDTIAVEYEYEIDAITGAILEYEQDDHDDVLLPPTGTGNTLIGLEQATLIALADAGQTAGDVRIVKQVSYEKRGVWYYDVIFLSSSTKYSYLINAVTGAVEERYQHSIGGNGNYGGNSQGNATGSSPQNSGNISGQYIGKAAAKDIALGHAGANSAQISKYDCELMKKTALWCTKSNSPLMAWSMITRLMP